MPTAPGNRPKGFLGRSPNAPEPSWSRVQTSLEQRAVSHTTTERCFVIFVVVRKLRYAFRISFYSVLLASHAVSSERVHAAKNIRILGISASQIEPGSVRASQNRARAAQSERQNAKKTHEGKRFFLWGCERLQLERESALRRRCWGARMPRAPAPPRVISIEIYECTPCWFAAT